MSMKPRPYPSSVCFSWLVSISGDVQSQKRVIDLAVIFSGYKEVTVYLALPRNASFVHPNPAHDYLQILTPGVEGLHLVNLYDQYGHLKQSLNTESADGMISMQLDRLQPGIYYIWVVSESGDVQSQKIVIE